MEVAARSGGSVTIEFQGSSAKKDLTEDDNLILTLGIISGAVWANEAWGNYWSWDPKETWALITWIIFATYLHSRITKGWQGKKTAILGSLGFFVIWVCYLGVNFLGKGLH